MQYTSIGLAELGHPASVSQSIAALLWCFRNVTEFER